MNGQRAGFDPRRYPWQDLVQRAISGIDLVGRNIVRAKVGDIGKLAGGMYADRSRIVTRRKWLAGNERQCAGDRFYDVPGNATGVEIRRIKKPARWIYR